MINLKAIPFLKILFPYLLGVVSALVVGLFKQIHLLFLVSVISLVLAFLFQKYYKPVLYFKKGIFIFCTNLFLFLLAFESVYSYNDKNSSEYYSNYITYANQRIMVVIDDIPVVHETYTKIPVRICAMESNNTWHYVNGKSILYLKHDQTKPLQIGHMLLLTTKFGYVNEPKNPYEFDYKTFLERKNVFHTLYSNYSQCHIIPDIQHTFSIWQLGVNMKARVVSVLKENGLSQQAFSICSALLVGYDDEIDSATMQQFSHSGTLHVLSVSGMHTGVLYGILLFLFGLFYKHDSYKKLKCFVVIACLCLFVCITGFSPSVLRAALMLALVILGKTFYKQGNAYNTLLLSAFILLLTNPFLLLDVGFLLSYLAVFGIMYLYPILNNLYFVENKILRWFWSVTLMSVCATIFTLPISLYFFHQFPIWFVFSNLVIIPLSMGLMLLAAIFIVCYKVLFLKQLLVLLINGVTNVMLWFTAITDNPATGYVDYISFTKPDVVLSFVLLYIGLLLFHTKQYKYMFLFGLVCILWLGSSIYTNYIEAETKELIVFHVKGKSALALRDGQKVYASWDGVTEKEFQRNVKPYLLSFSNLELVTVKANLCQYYHQSLLHVTEGVDLSVIHPNYLIVSNNASVRFADNGKIKPVIIADCSNSYNFVKQLRQECLKHDVLFYSVKENGAIQLSLSE